jgi:methylmalonyl-CoA/ethylmalonyl-CoA epimerase
MFQQLDHIAIVVPDTEAALRIWRDRLGLPVLFSEVVNNGATRLTHLDLGNTHLQLVEPLDPGHSLAAWLETHGPGLHHLCLLVDDVGEAAAALPERGLAPQAPQPHQGTRGKRALFIHPEGTGSVRVELTGR